MRLVLIWLNVIFIGIGDFSKSLFFEDLRFQRAGRNNNYVHFFTKSNRNFVLPIIIGVLFLESTLSSVTAAVTDDNKQTPARSMKKIDISGVITPSSKKNYGMPLFSQDEAKLSTLSPVPFPELSPLSKEVEEVELLSPVKPSNMEKLSFISIDYDDSSDEEYLEEKLDEYQEVCLGEDSSEEEVSKFLYSLGVHLLYSKPVNKKYYEKKAEFLGGQEQDRSHFEREVLKGILSSFIKENFLCVYAIKEEEIEGKVEEIIRPLSDEISEIFQECRILSSKLKKNEECYLKKLESVNKKITANIIEAFKSVDKKINKNEKADPQNSSLENCIIADIENIVREAYSGHISPEGKFTTSVSATKKEFRKPSSNNSPYKNVLEEVSPHMSPRKNTQFTYFLDHCNRSKLIEVFLEDFRNCRKKDKSTISPSPSFKKALRIPGLLPFVTLSPDEENILISSFSKYFKHHLDDKKSLFQKGGYKRRPVLSEDHVFEQKNAQDYLANIRLSNRSQKRKIKNYYGNPINNSLLIKDDGTLFISRITRCWRFLEDNSFLAFDEQGIQTSLGRGDKVILLGTYGDVEKEINDTFRNGKSVIFDKDIALCIRNIIKGGDKEFVGKFSKKQKLLLTSLSYLFLGCECTRNPSVFITNQMVLDLLIDDKIKWKEAFKIMTMVPKESVSLARNLGERCRDMCVFPYSYPGKQEKAEALFIRDCNIVNKWLEFCYINETDKDKSIKDIIVNKIKHWYGFDFETSVSEQLHKTIPTNFIVYNAMSLTPESPSYQQQRVFEDFLRSFVAQTKTSLYNLQTMFKQLTLSDTEEKKYSASFSMFNPSTDKEALKKIQKQATDKYHKETGYIGISDEIMHDINNVQYLRVFVDGSRGDCCFHALGIERKELIKQMCVHVDECETELLKLEMNSRVSKSIFLRQRCNPILTTAKDKNIDAFKAYNLMDWKNKVIFEMSVFESKQELGIAFDVLIEQQRAEAIDWIKVLTNAQSIRDLVYQDTADVSKFIDYKEFLEKFTTDLWKRIGNDQLLSKIENYLIEIGVLNSEGSLSSELADVDFDMLKKEELIEEKQIKYIRYKLEFLESSAERKKEILKDFYGAYREWLDPSAIMHLGTRLGFKAKVFKKGTSSQLRLDAKTEDADIINDVPCRLMMYVNENHYDLLYPIVI